MKDGSVNKQVVSESIISLKSLGVKALIDFLKKEDDSKYKLKEGVARSLATADVSDPSIDAVIELGFFLCKDRSPQVRVAAIGALSKLREKSKGDITYLKPKYLIPFLYEFLADISIDVRNIAILSIKNFGPQGVLTFIEGASKDKNQTVRKSCCYGLGLIGSSSFRTLLLVLHDNSMPVRK